MEEVSRVLRALILEDGFDDELERFEPLAGLLGGGRHGAAERLEGEGAGGDFVRIAGLVFHNVSHALNHRRVTGKAKGYAPPLVHERE